MSHDYLIATVYWIAVGIVIGKIFNHLMHRPPRRKEKKP